MTFRFGQKPKKREAYQNLMVLLNEAKAIEERMKAIALGKLTMSDEMAEAELQRYIQISFEVEQFSDRCAKNKALFKRTKAAIVANRCFIEQLFEEMEAPEQTSRATSIKSEGPWLPRQA
jgi:hypothetical protein